MGAEDRESQRKAVLLRWDFGESSGDDPDAFLDGNNLIDGDVGELIHRAAEPGDFQQLDDFARAQPEGDARADWVPSLHTTLKTMNRNDTVHI